MASAHFEVKEFCVWKMYLEFDTCNIRKIMFERGKNDYKNYY